MDGMAHDIYRTVLLICLVLSEQQQTGHDAPKRCDDGEITGKLSRGASMISVINAGYSQECHVGVQ